MMQHDMMNLSDSLADGQEQEERTRGGDARRAPRTPLWGFGCGGRCERECAGLFKVVIVHSSDSSRSA
jgi:hypothetical protein